MYLINTVAVLGVKRGIDTDRVCTLTGSSTTRVVKACSALKVAANRYQYALTCKKTIVALGRI
jgi:hypothetical protein